MHSLQTIIANNGHNGKNGHDLPGTIQDKLQPHNLEAEQGLLGSILINPDAIIRVATILKPGDFFIHRHNWIYRAMVDLYEQKQGIDLLTLSDELQRREQLEEIGGESFLTGLINATPTSIHAEFYAGIVVRTADMRRLIDGAGEIARLAYTDSVDPDDILDQAEQIIFNIASRKETQAGLRHIKAGLNRHLDQLEYLSQHSDQLIGIPTGLTDLDKLMSGLQRSHMVTLAGRPGFGKTSLALAIALNAARRWQKRVAIFSLEMSEDELVQKLVSSETGIDSQRLRRGKIKDDEWPVFFHANQILSETSIYIDDTPGLSPYELRSRARRLHAEHGLDLLVVDYLQLMRGDRRSENRQQEVSFISRSIKNLARELKIPVLALSQLSRQVESRHDKRPLLNDLRESGSIEQDSDEVIFMYRDDVYNPDSEFPNIVELILAKSRFGPTGTVSVYFKKHLSRFVDLQLRSEDYEPAPDWTK